MKLAIMQPYFLPYIGYFQLVAAVDQFVFFDDVNFIKKGWINRNAILHQKQSQAFSIPLIKVSQNKKINEVEIQDYTSWRQSFLHRLDHNYHKSIHFKEAFLLIQKILFGKDFLEIADLAAHSVVEVSKYIGLDTSFLFSSDLRYQGEHGQDKVIDICKKLNASTYINPQNGAFLYDRSVFQTNQLDLLFLEPVITEYVQFTENTFVPRLSIIDLLMFNSKETILAMARQCRLHKDNISK